MALTYEGLAQAEAALAKSRAALAENRLEEAIALAREAVGAAPHYTRAISSLAKALKRAGRHAEVRRLLTEAPDQLAGSPGDLAAMAAFCLREGVQDSAREILRCALEADPTHRRVAELLAGLYLAERNPVAAIAVCEPFRARGEASPALLRLQAVAYERLEDYSAALDCARLYVHAAPLDPRGYYHLATLEQRLGHIAEAFERYELAIDLDGGATEITSAAMMGVRALDAIQLRQITALAATDMLFRLALAKDPQEALESRGFVLSEEGLSLLASLDLASLRRGIGGSGYEFH
ncbi:MAG: tetratricopeptide repeat protein [Candidatus Zipacnadales bacterium]